MTFLTINKSSKFPVGGRYAVAATVENLSQTGGYVTSTGLGLSHVEYAFATCSGSPVAVGVACDAHSTATAGEFPGDVFLNVISGTGTFDVYLFALGRGTGDR